MSVVFPSTGDYSHNAPNATMNLALLPCWLKEPGVIAKGSKRGATSIQTEEADHGAISTADSEFEVLTSSAAQGDTVQGLTTDCPLGAGSVLELPLFKNV